MIRLMRDLVKEETIKKVISFYKDDEKSFDTQEKGLRFAEGKWY